MNSGLLILTREKGMVNDQVLYLVDGRMNGFHKH